MTNCTVNFQPKNTTLPVPSGTLIHEAAHEAGIHLNMPCGGQGRCGRCAVLVDDVGTNGNSPVRRRSTLRLSLVDVAAGYALACQTVIEGDAQITIPPQEKIERRLTTDRTVADLVLPFNYDPRRQQPMQARFVQLDPPSMDDQTDDWSRLARTLRREHGFDPVTPALSTLRKLGKVLREADWQVTVILEQDEETGPARLIDLLPGDRTERLLGAAIDIGTTSNVVYIVDLLTGKILSQAVDYNGQVVRGEDVISRIIYAGKNGNGRDGLGELKTLVLGTLNRLLTRAAHRI